MSYASSPDQDRPTGELIALGIDNGAALALCGILLEAMVQIPQARALIRATLERQDIVPGEGNPAGLASQLIAFGRVREACDAFEREAA